eukprot:TRINITY_DN23921_c0_g1_i1.p1 TRINITY_DN23921_c0_g1~~TRINITY_DN23921_c0_g1_i1.p1  ORF type:complete len:1306 (+),score=184.91 TRINITY_DN23921_c0_g1_i1:67-3918(+)
MANYEHSTDTPIAPGSLVQIQGIYDAVESYDLVAGALGAHRVAVEGKTGRCVGKQEDDRYVVQLFDGNSVLLERRHLEMFDSLSAEAGGFDLFWPPDFPESSERMEALGYLAYNAARTVAQKGWCLVQMTDDYDVRQAAVLEAKSLPNYVVPRKELMPDYLGQTGEGKMCALTDNLRLGGGYSGLPWALPEIDSELTALCKGLAPLAGQAFGFSCEGRRKGLVMMPFRDRAEAERLRPEPLTDEDVEAGVLDSHLRFIQRRRLCMMRFVDNTGGEIELLPRPGSEEASIKLPLTPGKLLIFRCDEIGFSYRPSSNDAVALITWIMDSGWSPTSELATGYFGSGSALVHSEALGIMVGPPMPTGHRMHVSAMHAHAPGSSLHLEGMVAMLTSGVDGFLKVPMTRFDVEIYCTPDGEHVPGKSYVRHMACMSDEEIINFDNDFFGIDPVEVKRMAPNQRLILEDGYTALQKAGFTRQTLNGRNTAAFLGDTGCDFDLWSTVDRVDYPLNPDKPVPWGNIVANNDMFSGVSKIISAGRLSHIFGLRGGSTNIDTACSASLVGVSVAIQSMRRAAGGQIRSVADKHNVDALCMGINVLTSPLPFIGLCGPSMLAANGRCFTFDKSAEGYARGDGFGAVYIKHSDAEEDYMEALGTFMGAYVNQDGRSATLTAPNGMAQQACIKDSMREAMVTASQITIAECHGTGTALGDPIEVGALRGVMEPRETPLLVTSAKSNIGHTEACAGMIGLIKCVTMVATSLAQPNCHLASQNPHLDVDGFPAYFETEAVETRLNSNYAGVSSFGFSGTNARADVWSRCKSGPRKAAQKMDLSKAEQIHVRCPVTLGPIEINTGEPVTESFKKKKGYKADVLRDEWASYDISAQAYEGGFRYRRASLPEAEQESDPDLEVCITGTWTAWSKMEEMENQGAGHYVATVVLGQGRYEMFRLCYYGDKKQELYPVIKDASEKIWIEGPDSKANGRYWIIDGRDAEIPAGTVYKVHFQWHPDLVTVSWEQVGSELALATQALPAHTNTFAILGTFSSNRFNDMKQIGVNLWEGSFRLGVAGEEEFQIAKDHDLNQLIYPATAHAVRTTVPVRGPDSLGAGKAWVIRGLPNEVIRVQVELSDGHVRVTVASEVRGEKVWHSLEGWDRHQYSVVASWSNWVPVPMVMDPSQPGVFRAFARMNNFTSHRYGFYVERFQIIVDEDRNQAFYPQVAEAPMLQYVVEGPGANPQDKHWLVRTDTPGARFEICLDLNVSDRRRRVSWNWSDAFSSPALAADSTEARSIEY